jgi:hypothetical protein
MDELSKYRLDVCHLIAQEDFIKFSHNENFKSYTWRQNLGMFLYIYQVTLLFYLF